MFEGHDTTASAIGFTLLFISQNARVQMKMVEEIKNVLGGRGTGDTAWKQSDLKELKYMEMVIKESMRLFPPVSFMGRRIVEEFELSEFTRSALKLYLYINCFISLLPDGKLIPAHTNIGIGVYQMGRDENVFENPLEFIPERFENVNFNPLSFVAWSRGPRDCIGRRFAMLELKNILVMILSTFELFDANFKPIIISQVVMRSKNGFLVGMRRRQPTILL